MECFIQESAFVRIVARTNVPVDAESLYHWPSKVPTVSARSYFVGTQCGMETVMADDKVKGPASYFPSIEKTYGQPISHWLTVIDEMGEMKHMEQVARLKDVHGLGHGHANALVAHHKAQNSG